MRILDDAEEIPEGIANRGYFDATPYIIDWLMYLSAQCCQAIQFLFSILNAPIDLDSRCAGLAIRDQAQLESADIEAHIKRFIEIWVSLRDLSIPRFRLFEISYWICRCS